MTWLPAGRKWHLVDAAGTVLASLEPDRDSGQYKDGSGRLVGRKWEEARARVEDAVRKGKS